MSDQKKTSASSTSSVGLADLASDLREPDLFGQSPSASENHIAKPSSANTGPTRQSSTTCEPSRQMDLEELTSSSVGSHASPGVRPGSKEARKMTETSGRKWLALLQSYGLNISLAKMCEALLVNEWASNAAFLTWRASATAPSHLLFRLVPSMPRTDGTAFGLLHTPTVAADQMAPSMKNRDPGSWWPTPQHRDFRTGEAHRFTDPQRSQNLNDAVAFWPTPTASDYRGSGPTVIRKDGKNRLNDRLDYATEQREPSGGKLNPKWVEWLMGFPEGWTDLKPSEMPSSRKSSRKSGGRSSQRSAKNEH